MPALLTTVTAEAIHNFLSTVRNLRHFFRYTKSFEAFAWNYIVDTKHTTSVMAAVRAVANDLSLLIIAHIPMKTWIISTTVSWGSPVYSF